MPTHLNPPPRINYYYIEPGDATILLVGGGAALFGDNAAFAGASKVVKPQLASVANALGAALAQVSSMVTSMATLDASDAEKSRQQALDDAKEAAIKK